MDFHCPGHKVNYQNVIHQSWQKGTLCDRGCQDFFVSRAKKRLDNAFGRMYVACLRGKIVEWRCGMEIPKRLKIGGHWYSIKCPFEFKERTDCWGHHSPSLKEIQITDTDLGGGKRAASGVWVTFLHELLHALDSIFGDNIFLGEKGEDNCHRLSEGIFQVLVDNGYLKLDKGGKDDLVPKA